MLELPAPSAIHLSFGTGRVHSAAMTSKHPSSSFGVLEAEQALLFPLCLRARRIVQPWWLQQKLLQAPEAVEELAPTFRRGSSRRL